MKIDMRRESILNKKKIHINYRFDFFLCTGGQKKKKKPIYFINNYHTEMKLVPIIMDYCPLQFGALKFFLGIHLHGGEVLYLTLIFSM